MELILQDLRYALRRLRKSPGFTATGVLTLALGIGATTALFSVADAVLLRPLPYPDPDRLVQVRETTPEGGDFTISESNYLDFRAENRSFTEMAAWQEADLALTGQGDPEKLDGMAVTHTLFGLLGATPAMGRTFTAAEDRPGGERVVLLAHGLWERRFGGDPEVLGQTLTLGGTQHTIVGVMRAGFEFPGDTELWVPLAPDPNHDRGDHWLSGLGRLRPGVDLPAAQADLAAVARGIGERYPQIAGWSVRLEPLTDSVVGEEFRTAVVVLLGAVGFLLLMACANLANLLLGRATARRTEIGIRSALGADRSRLVRQLLTESVVLAVLGSVAGLLAAAWAIGGLQALDPAGIPRLDEIAIDGRVVAFALSMGLLTSLVFGLIPAFRGSRTDLGGALRQGARGGTDTNQVVRDALVVGQVAVAIVLLVGAGLLMRSFLQLQAVDPGFQPDDIVAVTLDLPSADYPEPWRRVVYFSDVRREVGSLPGVATVGATAVEPFSDWNLVNDVTPVERAAEVGPAGFLQAGWRAVTPGFFEAMGIPLLRGRTFSEQDPWDGPRLAVISETLADRLWPDTDAVGQRLYWGGVDGTPLHVVGVVGDYRDVRLDADAPPVLFLPHNQLPWSTMTLVVRIRRAGAGVGAAALRDRIAAVDPDIPIGELRPLDARLSAAVAGPRFRTLLLGFFSVVALLLAAVGIYGVMAYSVTRRTREIGIRLALGAPSVELSGMLVRRAAVLALVGIGLGVAGALGLSRFLESLLFGVPATDPATFISVPLVLGAVALLAAWAPLRRALRVDPVEALRQE